MSFFAFKDTAIGTVVAKVWATDGDIGTNGEIQYEILAGNEDGSFTLSPNTGRIKIAKALDYEKRQSYSVCYVFFVALYQLGPSLKGRIFHKGDDYVSYLLGNHNF